MTFSQFFKLRATAVINITLFVISVYLYIVMAIANVFRHFPSSFRFSCENITAECTALAFIIWANYWQR